MTGDMVEEDNMQQHESHGIFTHIQFTAQTCLL